MKYYTVVISPRADRQLDALHAYIAAASGELRASNFVNDILASCYALRLFPERGAKRDDISENIRVMNHAGSVQIAFHIDHAGQQVTIEGIFYGGQDYETALHDADE